MTERVLWFEPHAGIWPHVFPEALVADALRSQGAQVIHITCGGAFGSFCVPMSAMGLTADSDAAAKAKVCAACRRNSRIIRDAFGFTSYDLERGLEPGDDAAIAALVAKTRRDDVSALVVDGVKVGQLALYEYLIHHKRSRSSFTEAEWPGFVTHLTSTLRSFFAARRILEREAPTRLVIYNTLYSVNAVWRAVAAQKGIPVYALHAGPNMARRLQTLMLGRDSTIATLYAQAAAWPEHANVPCSPEELAGVTDHFAELLKGQNVFVYSEGKAEQSRDWRAQYGIRPEQKLLVATMSSYDEYVAAYAVGEMPGEAGLVFPRQIEWIRALVEWMRDKPDRFLLIRVHPREFPNKREQKKSEHAEALERELVDLPPNVRVNWPADKLSLYDVAEYADVILNAWSSAGREMALIGRPVVVYCPSLLMYAPGINYVGETRETYFAAIEQALRDGWSFERVRMAYRWAAVELERSIASIADGFHWDEARATTLRGKLRNAAFTLPFVRQAYDVLRKPAHLAQEKRFAEVILEGRTTLLDAPTPRRTTTEAEETAALRRELGRLVDVLYRGARGAPQKGTLRDYLTTASARPARS